MKVSNNVYIYRDFEKVKLRTFFFKNIHKIVYIASVCLFDVHPGFESKARH